MNNSLTSYVRQTFIHYILNYNSLYSDLYIMNLLKCFLLKSDLPHQL